MAMSESELIALWEENLQKRELLDEGEHVEALVMGSYWDDLGQHSGNIYFTSEKLVYISGWGVGEIVIPYKAIAKIQKKGILFIPTGIDLTVKYADGDIKIISFAIFKRKRWVALLEQKTGIIAE